jgi:hypothetical protein
LNEAVLAEVALGGDPTYQSSEGFIDVARAVKWSGQNQIVTRQDAAGPAPRWGTYPPVLLDAVGVAAVATVSEAVVLVRAVDLIAPKDQDRMVGRCNERAIFSVEFETDA